METIESEGEELGHVRLLRGGSEGEKARRRLRRKHLHDLRRHSESSRRMYTDPRMNTEGGDFKIFLSLDLKSIALSIFILFTLVLCFSPR